ncbi:dethiobiotin synthase [Mycolicibacterium sp. 050158]|uniref:dethiobiotin synthase n=1 Tax=Mycolicibacterium sp. 050158 TaxID=3090602 RepID=UPI00299E63BD|nr:dethiobiotin synthase [Mycolicibacterium sp. 050158]MDX1891047.1 dethiobiotin synthase [Mycolicibacterium sp. 050158]
MSVVFVTGTDTGVGKTIATAALACHARLAGIDVAVCKPVQTGAADGDDDLGEVGRLSGVGTLSPGWRYPEPLAPEAAAERAGMALPTSDELLGLITALDRPDRLVLVEGAGGLLVRLGAGGVTLRDLAVELGGAVLVVARAGLGTLNHAELTVEAIAARALSCAGLVVGAWPAQPGVAETTNLEALGRIAEVRATLPDGAGTSSAEAFAELSAPAFDTDWVRSLYR